MKHRLLLWLKAYKFFLVGTVLTVMFEAMAFVLLVTFMMPLNLLAGLLTIMIMVPSLITIGLTIDFSTPDWLHWFNSMRR